MIGQSDSSERDRTSSRHSVVVRDDFFRPIPVKSEAVVAVAQVESSNLRDPASADVVVDEPTIIDESERCLSAGELYAAAHSGLEVETANKPRPRVSAPNDQRIQLWGAGTSGRPRRGSRTIRLFRSQPEQIFAALRARPCGSGLKLDAQTFEVREILAEPELRVAGHLQGAFACGTREVGITLRATRFNAIFTAVEIQLTERRYPRRFFRAAHDAIQSLPLPGRT